MKVISGPALSRARAIAVSVLALMIVAPVIWVAWSLNAAAATKETIRSQSDLLLALQQRLAAAEANAAETVPIPTESTFLPGATPAIAGAALQRTVTDTIQEVGGSVVESEIAAVQTEEEEPGRVDLRVSFDADIISLQRILFELESGMPVLLLRALTIQSPGLGEISEDVSPTLRVIMLVGGYWEAEAV